MGSILKHNQSYPQGLYEVSATAQAPLGAVLDLGDGRVFRYGQAGAVALSAGVLCQTAATIANHTLMATDTPAVGTNVVQVTSAGTVFTNDQYADGFLVFDATIANGGGAAYKVRTNRITNPGTDTICNVILYDQLWETVAAAATTTLHVHPCAGAIIQPSPPTASLTGVAARDIPISNFGWFQIKGLCGVLTDATTLIVGEQVFASITVDGCVQAATATYAVTYAAVGRCQKVSASTLFSTIDLAIL